MRQAMKTVIVGALLGVAAVGTSVPLCAESPTPPPVARPAPEPLAPPAPRCEGDAAIAPFLDAWMTEC